MTSMISLIVVLLAAYAYSAPVVTDFQNATAVMDVENATLFTEVENVTVGFLAENFIILARRDTTVVTDDKNGKVKVNLSSSESDSYETTDNPSYTTEHTKRGIESEDNEEPAGTNEERSFTEDSFTTENTKRGIEVEWFQSSTAEDETSTVEESSSHVQNVKRSLDDQPWLAADSSMKVNKRSIEIVELSTDVVETSTAEDFSVPSTSEVNHMNRAFGDFSSMTTEASEAFNRRAIGSVESVEAGEASTIIVIKVQQDSTTDEQPSSSTVEPVETTEFSSTWYPETTVVSVKEWTSVSPLPSESTPKILAIIPGTISRTQYVVPPVQQVQLSEARNQTILEAKKPDY